jgi:hypothetical protein
MSYIRSSTPMRRRKGDVHFEKTSGVYAWQDVNGWIYVTNIAERGGAMVRMTQAEMRHMCLNYVRKNRLKP